MKHYIFSATSECLPLPERRVRKRKLRQSFCVPVAPEAQPVSLTRAILDWFKRIARWPEEA